MMCRGYMSFFFYKKVLPRERVAEIVFKFREKKKIGIYFSQIIADVNRKVTQILSVIFRASVATSV